MSKIALTPNASGTGTLTIAAPSTNSDRTITLPDATTTLMGTDTSVTQAQLATALNASGSAPIYACRAWVNFNGTGTVAIRASGNVSSITDNGTGDYTVNFTTAMPDVNYTVIPGASVGGSGGWKTDHVVVHGVASTNSGNGLPTLKSTTQIRIISGHAGNTTLVDFSTVEIAIFR